MDISILYFAEKVNGGGWSTWKIRSDSAGRLRIGVALAPVTFAIHEREAGVERLNERLVTLIVEPLPAAEQARSSRTCFD